MNKNNLLILALAVAVLSNLTLYSYYELQAQAQITFLDEYTIEYATKEMIKGIESAENAKGCSKIHTDYTNADGSQGILTFTCDSRETPPIQKRQLNREQLLQEIAEERNVQLIGSPLP